MHNPNTLNQPQRPADQVPAWVIDALLGLAVTLVIGLVISADQGGRHKPDALAYGFAASFGALMLLRRRFPVLVLVATMVLLFGYYALGYPAIGLAVPVVAALYSASERGRFVAAVVVSVMLVAVSSYFRLRGGETVAYLFGYELASTLTLMATGIAFGDSVRARRALRAEQAHTAQLIEREQAYRAEQRVQAERFRMARELHDLIGHSMAVIALHTNVASEAIGRTNTAAAAALDHIRAANSQTLRELRAIVKLLRTTARRSSDPSHVSLGHLALLVDQVTAHGLQVDYDANGDVTALPPQVDATAYRIIREALTNVLRHANATQVMLRICIRPDVLQLQVVDNGTTPPAPSANGSGIVGMIERAHLIGGTLSARPRPSGGFEVVATLPLTEGAWQ